MKKLNMTQRIVGTTKNMAQKIFALIILMITSFFPVYAQKDAEKDFKYERASLCIIMEEHKQLEYNDEIEYVFRRMASPSRFNDHSLGVKVINFAQQEDQKHNIESFIKQVDLGKKFVAKWFNRNKKTGAFDLSLVKERGMYDATVLDQNLARQMKRGMAVLEDAGEKLIGNSYFVLFDVRSHNKKTGVGNFKAVANTILGLGESIAGVVDSDIETTTDMMKKTSKKGVKEGDSSLMQLTGFNSAVDKLQGFSVEVTAYLYKLKWTEENASVFYESYYTEGNNPDKSKITKWNDDKGLFSFEFVGSCTNKSTKIVIDKDMTAEQLITKVCTRALDKSLADLQHKFECFRIKAPIVSTEPLKAYIGMKEDITEKSRYEVLERSMDEQGRISYRRVGVVKPKKDCIWDNQFGAEREGTPASKRGYTTFEKVSGGDFYPGLLLREMK